jgi:hypothetical protein
MPPGAFLFGWEYGRLLAQTRPILGAVILRLRWGTRV